MLRISTSKEPPFCKPFTRYLFVLSHSFTDIAELVNHKTVIDQNSNFIAQHSTA